MLEKPAFIQGLFEFDGRGLDKPVSFQSPATYSVSSDKRAQTIYFRGGQCVGRADLYGLDAGWTSRCVTFRSEPRAQFTCRSPCWKTFLPVA